MSKHIDYARRDSATEKMTWNATETKAPFLAHPRDVVGDPTLSQEQKRSILASWLSDVHAVPDAPRWRQLDNGAFVDVHDLREALHTLDDPETVGRISESRPSSFPFWRHKQRKGGAGGRTPRRGNDDDDDPSPSPAGGREPVPPRPDCGLGVAEALSVAA
jgi:hypothetical protein